MPPVLDVQDLKTFFPTDAGTVRAVNGVSFAVREGETLAIVGESGSGKSVTGLTIMRLLGRAGAQIAGGEIWLTRGDGNRVDLARLADADMERLRGSEIAMIFQDPMSSLNPVFPVGEQIAEPLRLHKGLSRRAARAAAVELLALVGLSDPARQVDAFPHQLSGGMRQRIMIAIALACEPRLLIADEPTTALDVTVQAQIIALLRALQARRRMAMIFVTHDLHLVGDVADRVAVMYASQVVEEGPVADVLATPAHPYTRALLACVPRQQRGEKRRRMTPIPGTMPSALAVPSGCRFHPRCAHAAARCIEAVPALEAIAPDRRARCVRWREIGP
ncbi:ABC transporter ATP-binding protein [Vineibacter terrae]|uniref:ABC transporter ATP-binding protein n=1 Tax=Vineibacter terrae TaxID=2586908 RepID=A0A5C8PQ16_9HYPH|nr:ABC transporter ATP-binding protein [Vineibacter terrae]TXL76824.1 ABC transporter ATP-binding protein [Vineibacter terrae]